MTTLATPRMPAKVPKTLLVGALVAAGCAAAFFVGRATADPETATQPDTAGKASRIVVLSPESPKISRLARLGGLPRLAAKPKPPPPPPRPASPPAPVVVAPPPTPTPSPPPTPPPTRPVAPPPTPTPSPPVTPPPTPPPVRGGGEIG